MTSIVAVIDPKEHDTLLFDGRTVVIDVELSPGKSTIKRIEIWRSITKAARGPRERMTFILNPAPADKGNERFQILVNTDESADEVKARVLEVIPTPVSIEAKVEANTAHITKIWDEARAFVKDVLEANMKEP